MRWLAATLSLVLLFALAAPVQAWEGDTLRVGGPGGAQDRDDCGGGNAMVGLSYKAGKDLNVVWMTCSQMVGGAAIGHPYDRGAWGDGTDNGHGMQSGNIGCPDKMVVQAIYATMSGVKVVHDFWLLCRNLITGEHYQAPWSLTNGGRGGRAGNANCGDDGYARGMLISHGSLVDAIGLICVNYHPPAPTPVPKVDKPIRGVGKAVPAKPAAPKPDKPPLKVDNGGSGEDEGDDQANAGGDDDNGGNGFRAGPGKGGGTTAATDTTIYDQPDGSDVDYISAGDPVTIVSCNENNWCRISKPRKGWVWGDDLNR